MKKSRIRIDVPGFGKVQIDAILCDYTGTLAFSGKLVTGVKDRLLRLAEVVDIHVVTADSFQASSHAALLTLIFALYRRPSWEWVAQGRGSAEVRAVGRSDFRSSCPAQEPDGSSGVRQLAAAFGQASLLAVQCRAASGHSRARASSPHQSGSKLPHSGAPSSAELNVGNALGDLAQVLAVGHDICGKRHARLCPVPILGDSH